MTRHCGLPPIVPISSLEQSSCVRSNRRDESAGATLGVRDRRASGRAGGPSVLPLRRTDGLTWRATSRRRLTLPAAGCIPDRRGNGAEPPASKPSSGHSGRSREQEGGAEYGSRLEWGGRSPRRGCGLYVLCGAARRLDPWSGWSCRRRRTSPLSSLPLGRFVLADWLWLLGRGWTETRLRGRWLQRQRLVA